MFKVVSERNGVKFYVEEGLEDLFKGFHPGEAPALITLRLNILDRILFKLLKIPVYYYCGGIIIGFTTTAGDSIPLDVSGVEVRVFEPGWKVKLELYNRRLPRILALPLSEIDRFLKFITVNGIGVLVNLLAAELAHRSIRGDPFIVNPAASTIGFESSVMWNYALNEAWTFRGAGLKSSLLDRFSRLARYHAASVASWIMQALLSTLLPVYLKTPFWLGQLAGIIAGFTISFILGYVYTWSRDRI
ncbi:MAG: GtrA family protein [Desulfurococcus sp.]|nr:GtrA family protein [Desulfurococcus sp.]